MKTVPHRMTLLDETHRGILQAYDIHYQESVVYQSFPLHWHVFYELELVVSGSGVQWINGHAMRLEPGSFYLLSPTDMHRIIANEPLSFYSVKVPSDKLPAVFKKPKISESPVVAQLSGKNLTVCRLDFHRLKSFLSNPSPYGESNAAALIMLLLSLLFDTAMPGQRFVSTMAIHRQHRVLEYIHSHFLTPITLSEIADVANLSPNYLSAQFVQVVGCGYVEYLTQLRIQHACTLLMETEMSVTDIAYESGFGSLSHFIRTFHRQKHITPSAFRNT